MAMPNASTIIAFDYGYQRTGVAVGNSITRTASAVDTLFGANMKQQWQDIDTIMQEWQPAQLLIGMPLQLETSSDELLAQIKSFKRKLKQRYDLPVYLVDESYSSVEANERLKELRRNGRKKKLNKKEIDAQAAVIILERWLRGDDDENRPE